MALAPALNLMLLPQQSQKPHQAINPLFPLFPTNGGPTDLGVRPQSSCCTAWPQQTSTLSMPREEDFGSSSNFFSTLPKPPLKGILKNPSYPAGGGAMGTSSSELLLAELDVLPFDNVPPCDDCVAKAKIKGSYSGECEKRDCAMGGSLRRKRPYQQRCTDGFIEDEDGRRSLRGSRRSLSLTNGGGVGVGIDDAAAIVASVAASKASRLGGSVRGSSVDIFFDSNNGGFDGEVIENVESSV